jgi:hypothetical protein
MLLGVGIGVALICPLLAIGLMSANVQRAVDDARR